jgi:3-oxoacyl-[acyl-carrier-protein] synthase II
MKPLRKVVVTGIGIASPAGYTLEENYQAWRSGRNCFTEITRFNTFGSSVVYAGDCAAPDAKKLPDRKVQKILRRKDIISLLCTIDAAAHAGIKKGSIDPERFGMYVGAGSTQIGDLTPYFTLVAECANLDDGTFDSAKFGAKLMELVNPLVVLQTLMNNALCFGTMTLDIRGVNSNFMDFHVAGLRAIGEAFRSIAYGRADAVIAGGVAGPVEPFQLAEGIHSGYLAKTKDLKIPVSEVVRPWDQNRMGAVLSEGSAYLVLEEESHAVARGANILARIQGYQLASDGSFDFTSQSEGSGLARSMDGALIEAGLKAQDVGFVVGHGNGSKYADSSEAKSYTKFFGDFGRKLPLVSNKSCLGDMCEAGGAVGVILALESIAKGEIPPTFNFKSGDAYSGLLSIKPEPQKILNKTALITSRNFVGLSASLIVTSA